MILSVIFAAMANGELAQLWSAQLSTERKGDGEL
jgi:hypothetical protein